MKKDEKFLNELRSNLRGISNNNKDSIINKYRNIIKEEKSSGKKITNIIKNLGKPSEIAKMEIDNIKSVPFKQKLSNFFSFISKDLTDKKVREERKEKRKEKKILKEEERINKQANKELDIIEDSFEETNTIEENNTVVGTDSVDVLKEKISISKVLKILLVVFLLFIWLWVSIILIASLFALMDGIKLFGLNIGLLALDFLVLWVTLLVIKMMLKKKINYKLNLIVIISCIFLMAFGIASAFYKIYKTDRVTDVGDKYTMTTKIETFNLPSNKDDNMYITFNSNYDTQFMIDYDNTLDNKVKLEIKYFECYYDYYSKLTTNNAYISLKLDTRDRISVYIDDFKEGKIYDTDELSRYTVKITINEKDYKRLIVQN